MIILLDRLTVALAARNVQEEIEMRRTVLLVEDEAKLADVLAEQLAQDRFAQAAGARVNPPPPGCQCQRIG